MTMLNGFRLSPQQRRAWLIQQASCPGAAVALCAVRISGPLAVARWLTALQLTVRRHEILRTTFRLLPGMRLPLQYIADDAQHVLAHHVHDLQGYDSQNQPALLEALIKAVQERDIDITNGPVLHVTQIILRPDQQCWLLALPTLCADGPAMNYLAGEVCATYQALHHGADHPDALLQYADVAEIFNQELDQASGNEREHGEQPAEEAGRLAFERRLQGAERFTPARYEWNVTPAQTRAVRALAEDQQVTPATVLLACWMTLLWRLSGGTISTVGVVAGGRIYAELEQALGPFDAVRLLPYRLDGLSTMAEALQQIHQACDIVGEEVLTAPVTSAPQPRFTFVVHPAPELFQLDDQCVCTVESYRALLAPFSAQLSVYEGSDQIQLAIDYDTDRYDPADIERLAETYDALLMEAPAAPALRLCRYSLVRGASRERLLVEFNQTDQPFRCDDFVDQLFSAQAQRTPDRIVVQHGMCHLTYHALDSRSEQLRHALHRRGVRPEQLVALYLERSPEMIVAMLATLKVGAAYVPIDPTYPAERVRQILEDTGARCVLTQAALAPQLPDQTAALCLDRDWPQIAQEPDSAQEIAAGRGRLAYVLYTSGSTGAPKGVMIEHGALINLVMGLRHRFYGRFEAPANVALLAAYVFDASVQQIFSALLFGHTLCIAPEAGRRDGALLLRFYQEQRIAISDGTPALLTILLNSAELEKPTLPIQEFLIGGEALQPALVAQFYRMFGDTVRLTNIYGPAECCVDTNAYTVLPEDAVGRTSIPIGPPLPNRHAYVLDDNLEPVPIGVPAELYIAGAGLGRGYWNNPAATASRFLPDPFGAGGRMYRTGDLCRWLPDGSLDFLERVDLQVQIRGFRVELEEVEAALRAHPAVQSVVVAARQRQRASVPTCRRCFLSTNMPNVRLDAEGICMVCRAYEQYQDRIAGYFGHEAELVALFEHTKLSSPSSYDCLFLYSGGKDSTYALYRLAELGLRILVATVDNGFLSAHTHTNIQRVCADLQLELEVIRPRHMNDIFVESLRSHSSVCDGCFRAINALGSQMAIERGIPTLVTALSRGQIYTKLTNFLLQHEFDPQRIDQELLAFRKVHYASQDRLGKLIHYNNAPPAEASLDRLQFVDFFRYCDVTQEQLLAYLRAKGAVWEIPPDTGFGSSDCLINEAGVNIHLQERGYHFYADQLSWEVRIGHISANLARARLEERTSEQRVNQMLAQIGYRRPIKQSTLAEIYLCAYVVPKAAVSAEELRGALSRRLPEYMVPSTVVFCESFPMTVNGKIDRKALPEPDIAGQRARPYVAPSNTIEQWLATLWEETLGIARVGIHDTFFELGGHSLAATQVMTRTSQAFQIDLPIRTLFEHDTVAALARVVQQRLLDQMIAQVEQQSSDILLEVGTPEDTC